MSLGSTPSAQIYGANAALLNKRLISWQHIDAAGIESDQLILTLDLEGLDGLPDLGGKIGLRVGYLESALIDKGQYFAAYLSDNCLMHVQRLCRAHGPSHAGIRHATQASGSCQHLRRPY